MFCRMILIAVVTAFLLLAGCDAPGSSQDFRPLSAAVLAVHSQGVSPSPAPKPVVPGGKCDACNGTGRVGDGRVSVPCQKCGGDGKL